MFKLNIFENVLQLKPNTHLRRRRDSTRQLRRVGIGGVHWALGLRLALVLALSGCGVNGKFSLNVLFKQYRCGVLDRMTNERDCAEMLNMLVVAMLPPLHHRERIYLQIENNSTQYERFVAGLRLTHDVG